MGRWRLPRWCCRVFRRVFDYVDNGTRTSWREWISLTAAEVEALAQVLDLMDAASSATAQNLSAQDLVATG